MEEFAKEHLSIIIWIIVLIGGPVIGWFGRRLWVYMKKRWDSWHALVIKYDGTIESTMAKLRDYGLRIDKIERLQKRHDIDLDNKLREFRENRAKDQARLVTATVQSLVDHASAAERKLVDQKNLHQRLYKKQEHYYQDIRKSLSLHGIKIIETGQTNE